MEVIAPQFCHPYIPTFATMLVHIAVNFCIKDLGYDDIVTKLVKHGGNDVIIAKTIINNSSLTKQFNILRRVNEIINEDHIITNPQMPIWIIFAQMQLDYGRKSLSNHLFLTVEFPLFLC